MKLFRSVSRVLAVMSLLCLSPGILSGCQNSKLPMPQFPLEKPAVEQALAESGLDWEIAQEETLKEGHVVYTLSGKDGQPVAFLSSLGSDKTRILQINFLDSEERKPAIPYEDWEKAICLASILYGGFDSAGQVCENFNQTYEEKSVADTPGNGYQYIERIQWQNQLNGVHCFLGFGSQKAGGQLSEAEFVTIYFSKAGE